MTAQKARSGFQEVFRRRCTHVHTQQKEETGEKRQLEVQEEAWSQNCWPRIGPEKPGL